MNDTEILLRATVKIAELSAKVHFLENALGRHGETVSSLYPSGDYRARLRKEFLALGLTEEAVALALKKWDAATNTPAV